MKTMTAAVSSLALSFLTACGPEPDALSEFSNPREGQEVTPAIRTQGIINGTAASGTDMQGIPLITSNGHICSGALIAPNVVLTAAHCFYVKGCSANGSADCQLEPDADKFTVIFRDAGGSSAALTLTGQRIVIHPSYRHKAPFPNDIALLVLSGPATGIASFPWLPSNLHWSASDIGTSVTIVGYGVTSHSSSSTGSRMRMTAPVSHFCDPSSAGSKQGCWCNYGSGFCSTATGPCTGTERFCLEDVSGLSSAMPLAKVICHVPNSQGQIICSGDSGGPALVTRQGVTYVGGVTSFSDNDCRYLGCSTDVSAYADWIENTLNDTLGLALANGSICEEDLVCSSGHCVDGVCCDTDCPESITGCQACTVAKGATRNGVCTVLSGPCFDGDACTLSAVCQNGVCTAKESVVCDAPPEGSECTAGEGHCNPSTGKCDYGMQNDGNTCGDGGMGRCLHGDCLSQDEYEAAADAGTENSDAATPQTPPPLSTGWGCSTSADSATDLPLDLLLRLSFICCLIKLNVARRTHRRRSAR